MHHVIVYTYRAKTFDYRRQSFGFTEKTHPIDKTKGPKIVTCLLKSKCLVGLATAPEAL